MPYVVFGLISYSAMLTTIVLGSKPKFIDLNIGLPKVYQIHMFTAIFIVITMNLHKLGFSSFGMIGFFGEAASFIFTVIIVFSMIYYTRMITKYIPLLQKVKTLMENYIKHEWSLWVHRLCLVATLFVFMHVSLIDYIRNIPYFYPLFVIYSLIAFIFYALYLKEFYLQKTNATLINLRPLDQEIHELVFQLDQTIENYIPGQFVFISFPKQSKLKEAHPFSIVSIDKSHKQLTFGILDNGDFTNQLSLLSSGEPAILSKSYGILPELIQQANPQRPLVILIGGIGITPFVSLLKNVPTETYIYYSVKLEKQFIYTDEINHWKLDSKVHVVEQKERITLEQIKHDVTHFEQAQFILAGPAAMNDAFTKQLEDVDISMDQIFCENFSW